MKVHIFLHIMSQLSNVKCSGKIISLCDPFNIIKDLFQNIYSFFSYIFHLFFHKLLTCFVSKTVSFTYYFLIACIILIDQIVVSFCYSARTREGVQLAFEELVEKVHVHVDHNVYK